MMRLLLQGCLLLGLASCGAQWQSLRPDQPIPAREDLHDFSGPGRAQGHRDYPQSFLNVWQATIETLHARGVGVPRSAVPRNGRVDVDLDGLHVLVEERFAGRVCVLVRFRGLEEVEGEIRSKTFLDEILNRL